MNHTRVLVTEDDEFTRALLVNALQSEDFDVVIETSSASYALKTASRMRIDVAVLDLDLGRGPTGLDLALGLRRSIPNIGIVFLTSYKDPRLLNSNSNMAPFGSVYLQKSELGDLSRIRRGIERSIVNSKNAHTKTNIELKTLGKTTDLTATQIDILRLVAEGKSNQEIAAVREVTEKSIEQTLSRILKKAGIDGDEKRNRRIELARFYLRQVGAIRDEAV
jgi:DNA-binding NarL/FixJ family response regulator